MTYVYAKSESERKLFIYIFISVGWKNVIAKNMRYRLFYTKICGLTTNGLRNASCLDTYICAHPFRISIRIDLFVLRFRVDLIASRTEQSDAYAKKKHKRVSNPPFMFSFLHIMHMRKSFFLSRHENCTFKCNRS